MKGCLQKNYSLKYKESASGIEKVKKVLLVGIYICHVKHFSVSPKL